LCRQQRRLNIANEAQLCSFRKSYGVLTSLISEGTSEVAIYTDELGSFMDSAGSLHFLKKIGNCLIEGFLENFNAIHFIVLNLSIEEL
jgi:hypothetical protein